MTDGLSSNGPETCRYRILHVRLSTSGKLMNARVAVIPGGVYVDSSSRIMMPLIEIPTAET